MAVKVSDVRTETQIPAALICDDDILYVIGKVADNLNAVCAYVCKLLLRKYRGRTKIRIGRGIEEIDYDELRSMIRGYESAAGYNLDDGFVFDDPFFTRDGM